MRCGKYVSLGCTFDFAPVQVRNTFGVFVTHIPGRRGLHDLTDHGGGMIEPSTALYEQAVSASSEPSNGQLEYFRVADHIHPPAHLDVL